MAEIAELLVVALICVVVFSSWIVLLYLLFKSELQRWLIFIIGWVSTAVNGTAVYTLITVFIQESEYNRTLMTNIFTALGVVLALILLVLGLEMLLRWITGAPQEIVPEEDVGEEEDEEEAEPMEEEKPEDDDVVIHPRRSE